VPYRHIKEGGCVKLDYQTELLKLMTDMVKQSNVLIEATGEFQTAEEKYKILRAKVFNLAKVQEQPNQVLREAEADIIMQNDERFRPLYESFLTARKKQKEAYIRLDVVKELLSSYRVLINNLTFAGKQE
jgi:hypothetical protein